MQALRHRRWQAVVLVGVSTLITGCAVFGPWFARAVEQSITTTTLEERRNQAAWLFAAAPNRGYRSGDPTKVGEREDNGKTLVTPEGMDEQRPADLAHLFEPPVYGMTVRTTWHPATSTIPNVSAALVWRDGFCDRVVITKGRCPTRPGEVIVSTADISTYLLALGHSLTTSTTDLLEAVPLRIVGVYELADSGDPYWFGAPPVGRSLARDGGNVGDFVLTARSTFDQHNWGDDHRWGYTSTVETAPRPGKVRVDDLDLLVKRAGELNAKLDELGQNVEIKTRLPEVRDTISAGRKQTAQIIPLVMTQVALFGLAVLALAASALVDQRRTELGVARLRGRGVRATGRELLGEMTLLVAIGAVAGVGAALAVVTVVRRTWLNGTAPAELPWTVLAAIALSLVTSVLAVWFAIRPVTRQPIAALLRRVPPRRRSYAVGPLTIVLMSLAVAGVVVTLTGDGRGPLAVVTPTLLALGAALAAATALAMLAGYVGVRRLRRGHVVTGLAVLGVARRSDAGRIVPVVAVATALVAFAGQASSIAEYNRERRAGLEIGAAEVLELATTDIGKVQSVLDRVDAPRAWSTPVVLTTLPSQDALQTMGVELDSFRRIAIGGAEITDPATFDRIRAADVAPVTVRGERLLVSAEMTRATAPEAINLAATYVNAAGSRSSVRLGRIPSSGTVQLSAPIKCRAGCRLVEFTAARDGSPARDAITLRSVRGDGDRAPVVVGRSEDWIGVQTGLLDGEAVTVAKTDSGLELQLNSIGSQLTIRHRSVPVALPAIVTPDYEVTSSTATPGFDGLSMGVERAGPMTGPVPRNLYRTAVVDVATMKRWGAAGSVTTPTAIQLWLNEAGQRQRDVIVSELKRAGIGARVLDRLADRDDRYAGSASALALRLTPIVGGAAWTLALVVLLLMAISTRRARSHDHASLQLAGVRSSALTRAALLEQVGLVGIALCLGSVAGVVGGQLALPLIPLFEAPEPAIPVDLGVNWPTALLSIGLSGLVLTAWAVVLVSWQRRSSSYSRLREEVG